MLSLPHPAIHGDTAIANRAAQDACAKLRETLDYNAHGVVAALVDDDDLGCSRPALRDRLQTSVKEFGAADGRDDDRGRESVNRRRICQRGGV
jgi:hypothetical protein